MQTVVLHASCSYHISHEHHPLSSLTAFWKAALSLSTLMAGNLPTVSALNVFYGQFALICSVPTLVFHLNGSSPSLMIALQMYL